MEHLLAELLKRIENCKGEQVISDVTCFKSSVFMDLKTKLTPETFAQREGIYFPKRPFILSKLKTNLIDFAIGEVNIKNVFHLYTKQKGELEIDMFGPSMAKLNLEENTDGSITVSYEVFVNGRYIIDVEINKRPISGSPKNVFVPAIETFPLITCQVKKPVEHQLVVSGLIGNHSSVFLNCFSETLEVNPCSINGNIIVLRFTPEKMGLNYLHVFLNDMPLVGNPFHISVEMVEEKENAFEVQN